MDERPHACPTCHGTVLIKSGHACGRQRCHACGRQRCHACGRQRCHACGRQRWKCKGCGRQFTRTEPRGKPAALKRHAIELYCLGLSMSAIAKHIGVSAQTMLRWVRDHAQRHCPKPEPVAGSTAVVELDEIWHFVKKSPASCGSGRRSSVVQAG